MRKYVISGASSGVGFSTAKHFQRNGNKVVAIGRRPVSFSFTGGSNSYPIEYHSLDYTKPYSFAHTFGDAQDVDIDGIVHCSAQFKMTTLRKHTEREIVHMISVNLTSAIQFVRYFQPRMKPNGTIVLISSVSGLRGQKHQTVYSATKHGMQGFADSLRQEISQRVTTICPGGINTPLWNLDNPYPGDVEKLLKPKQIAALIADVMASTAVFKNIILHSENESH